MDEQTRQLVQAVHDAPFRLVIVTAGAGTQALRALTAVAGASRTLLEALVPYSAASFNAFLGHVPEKYVAPEVARLLAGRAYLRARHLEKEGHPVIGLACTATIATDRRKRGEHRACIATWQQERVSAFDVHFAKGQRTRNQEEALISNVMLSSLAQAANIEITLPLTLTNDERLTTATFDFAAQAHSLAKKQDTYFGIEADGRLLTAPPKAVLSGSFNPLHQGHIQLAQAACAQLHTRVVFECTAVNADKPPLPVPMLLERMGQFAGHWPIYASNAATFVEKSRLYPGATFVVGYDTAVRILNPRYYHNNQMEVALTQIRQQGCSFLVAGRVDKKKTFHHPHELPTPPEFADLFRAIPPHHFRVDLSSTEIRTGK